MIRIKCDPKTVGLIRKTRSECEADPGIEIREFTWKNYIAIISSIRSKCSRLR